MYAIAVLAVFAGYLIVCAIVITIVVFIAKKLGRRPLIWAIAAGLVMYNLVFWDFIPTYVVYKYYCVTKAGFWVYKTPEQWKAENPGVAETLTWQSSSNSYSAPEISGGFRLNERIVWTYRKQKAFIVPVEYIENLVIDLKNNKILIRQISVQSGYPPGKKSGRFWTSWPNYQPEMKNFYLIESEYQTLGRKVK